RHDEDAFVAPDAADQGEPGAGVPRRGLDDRRAGTEQAAPLGVLDDVERDAIFHRAAGVQVLQLDEDVAFHVRGDFVQLHDRCIPDRLDDIGARTLHGAGFIRLLLAGRAVGEGTDRVDALRRRLAVGAVGGAAGGAVGGRGHAVAAELRGAAAAIGAYRV